MTAGFLIIAGFVVVLLMSMVLHEYAHAYVANLCGDYTAEAMGRLTLNPIKHIDPIMTILLPAVLLWSGSPFIFGGAKPVPVNPYNFRRFRRDSRLVSAAGVVTNLTIAIGLSIVLHLAIRTGVFTIVEGEPSRTSPGVIVLGMGIIFNLILFAFNLLPIPPLDGSRILRSFFPGHLEALFDMMDRFGIILIFVFFSFFTPVIQIVIGFFWYRVLQFNDGYLETIVNGLGLAWNSLVR